MSDEPGLRSVACGSWAAPAGPAGRPAAGAPAGGEGLAPGEDCLAVEEPIEIRIAGEAVATVMRTPGSDRELAVGFLFNEGWISGAADVGSLSICRSGEHPRIGNVADLLPADGRRIDARRPPRASPATASCGVCGKRTIEEVLAAVPPLDPLARGRAASLLSPEALRRMPGALRAAQRLFERTGALHAAGIFDREARLLVIREDVGRHNAVDKAVGACLLAGELPLRERVLLVSGRASFEIVQKALSAGVPLVAAVSGVSSLARDLAEEGGVTLVGFLRESSFKVYSHPQRIGA